MIIVPSISRKRNIISSIYKITNLSNGKFYIGSSCDTLSRIYNHNLQLSKGNHDNLHLQRSWNKHGKEKFLFEIIQLCPKEYLLKLEQWFIDNLKPKYNMCKIANSRKNIVISEETRKRLSLSHLGIKPSLETREKMSNTRKGKSHILSISAQLNRKEQFKNIMNNCRQPENIIKRSKVIIQYTLKGEIITETTMYELKQKGFNKIQFKKENKNRKVKSQGYLWEYKN